MEPNLPLITILMPVYNGFKYLDEAMKSILNQTFQNFEFIIIDDGSTDDTWTIIKQLCEKHKSVRGLKLSKNFGHQNALLAGLTRVNGKCDFVISIDADLQQDINAIPEMIEKYYSHSHYNFQ